MRFFRYSPAVTKGLRYWKSQRPVGSSRARVSYRPSMEISSKFNFIRRFGRNTKCILLEVSGGIQTMHLYEQSSLLKNRLPCVFFLATHLNPKMTFCIYEERFRPNPLSYRALCCPFFFWYQHSRRQMSTLKGAL